MSAFKLRAMVMAASRRPFMTEARYSIPDDSIGDIWRTVRHKKGHLPVCNFPPTIHTHFHFHISELEVKLAKLGNLERSKDISDLGELVIGNSLRNVYRSLKIYCEVFCVPCIPLLTTEVRTYSNIFYLEYSAVNFNYRETLFTPNC